jgi:hypothetical protein
LARLTRKELALLRAQAKDLEINRHNLKWEIIRDRIQNRNWTIEDAFGKPAMSRSDAGRISAQKPHWRNFTIKESKNEIQIHRQKERKKPSQEDVDS